MRAEIADDLGELRIVDPDFHRAWQAPARRDDGVVGILLFRGHLVVGDFGIASEGRGLRCHFFLAFPRCFALTAHLTTIATTRPADRDSAIVRLTRRRS